jgi:ADP-ribosyl-[dinitrogen reductase] hydrolase
MFDPSLIVDRVLGCVIGGAVGDAMGAPYEGLWSHSLPDAATLLADYAEFHGYPRGQYTDDTQLTIATLQSIVHQRGIEPAEIARSISRLWRTQAVVGPGGACTAAADRLLAGGHWSDSGAPVGQAGNGTAMRTAALGLYFCNAPSELGNILAHVSRITHQDPRSIAGGVAIASAARFLCVERDVQCGPLCRAVADDMQPFDPAFAELVALLPEKFSTSQNNLMEYVAWSGMSKPEFDKIIITPYVVPTVLAALWAVICNPTSWSDAVTAVIRLGGDVDTLGAIVGGLMGARLGFDAIPQHLRDSVLNSIKLQTLARRYAKLITI